MHNSILLSASSEIDVRWLRYWVIMCINKHDHKIQLKGMIQKFKSMVFDHRREQGVTKTKSFEYSF